MDIKAEIFPFNPDGSGPWRVHVTTAASGDPRLWMGGNIDCPAREMAEAIQAALTGAGEGESRL
jgi:hypothetical protein